MTDWQCRAVRKNDTKYYEVLTSNGKKIATCASLKTARLIVAAPAMLKTLKSVLSCIEAGDDHIYDRDDVRALEKLIQRAIEGNEL